MSFEACKIWVTLWSHLSIPPHHQTVNCFSKDIGDRFRCLYGLCNLWLQFLLRNRINMSISLEYVSVLCDEIILNVASQWWYLSFLSYIFIYSVQPSTFYPWTGQAFQSFANRYLFYFLRDDNWCVFLLSILVVMYALSVFVIAYLLPIYVLKYILIICAWSAKFLQQFVLCSQGSNRFLYLCY